MEEPPPTEDEDSLQPGPILREDYLKQTMSMSGQNKKTSLVWDQKNLLMNLGMEDTHLSVGVDMEGLTCRLRSHTLVALDLM